MKKKRILMVITMILSLICIMDIFQTNNKIYTTGIKNKGIDYLFPKRLTTDSYARINLLLNEEDQKNFQACYKKEKKQYTLKKCNTEKIKESYIEAQILHYMFYNALQKKSSQDITLGIQDASNAYNVLAGRNEKQRIEYLKIPKSKVKEFSEKTKKEYVYKNIVVEESKFGLNSNKLRDNYIAKKNIRIIIDSILIILISIIELKWLKSKRAKAVENILLGIILEIALFLKSWKVGLIQLGIFLGLWIVLYFLNKKKISQKQFKIEKEIYKKIHNKNPFLVWILITIILTGINQIIGYLFQNYHILVGINPEVVINDLTIIEYIFLLSILYMLLLIRIRENNAIVEDKIKTTNRKIAQIKEEKKEKEKKKSKEKKKKKKKN